MALLSCPECERDVSDRASACPHCGCPVKISEARLPPKKSSVAVGFGGCFGVLLAIVLVILVLAMFGS